MKCLLIVALAVIFTSTQAEEPRCEKGRWDIDSLVLFTGGENCEDRVVACHFQNTRSEGWYSYNKSNELNLVRGNCFLSRKPECVDLDNGKFGWLVNSHVSTVERCVDMDVVCSYKGTDQEGWYAYPSDDRRIVTYANCADE